MNDEKVQPSADRVTGPPVAVYTAEQAARFLFVSVDTVYREVAEGRLACVKIGKGRNYRFTRDQLEAYLKRQSFGPNPCPPPAA